MKKLNDYKDEIHKCSKCGLCQSVCPIYEITGNDCSVSRGKFIMLNGIIKGDLKLNNNVNKYLDMCLKCNACKNFCPSGIDARKIFLAAKGEYFEAQNSKLIKILNSALMFNLFMNLTKIATNTYRSLRINKIVKTFYPVLQRLGWFGRKAILANEFVSDIQTSKHIRHAELVSASIQYTQTGKIPKQVRDDKNSTTIANIIYFTGCVNEYINPRTKIAVENILNKMSVKIIPANFNCCGVPFLSGGNIEQFRKQAEYNLAQIPDDLDYFLTDCASCQNAFLEYENYIDDEKLLEKLKKINAKSINVVDFILKNTKSIEFAQKTFFTFHKPCHLENIDFLGEFLKKTKNVEYIEMKDFDKCCGFSGEFAIKNPELSEQISVQKVQNAVETNADYILTSCPACVLGLTQGIIKAKNKMQNAKCIMSFVEFLSLARFELQSDYENEDCSKELLDNFIKKCF